jgi:hypothetical protein
MCSDEFMITEENPMRARVRLLLKPNPGCFSELRAAPMGLVPMLNITMSFH